MCSALGAFSVQIIGKKINFIDFFFHGRRMRDNLTLDVLIGRNIEKKKEDGSIGTFLTGGSCFSSITNQYIWFVKPLNTL